MGKRAPTLYYKRGYYSRHTDAQFNSNETDAFMAGAWVQVKSSNVLWARWDEATETLHLQFRGKYEGKDYPYPDFDRARALGFAVAPSKGGYVHDWLK